MTLASTPPVSTKVHRVEIHPASGQPDLLAASVLDQVREAFGFATSISTCDVYLIQVAVEDQAIANIAHELLTDPISQRAVLGASDPPGKESDQGAVIEVHFKPGVMDPVAQSTREAIVQMLPELGLEDVQVRTGKRYDLLNTDAPGEAIRRFAQRFLANPVIEQIDERPVWPESFPEPRPYAFQLMHVPVLELDDEGLIKLSHDRHLFLNLEEMQAVREYFSAAGSQSREPTDIELETIAQTWSEHCVHKTFKSTIHYHESRSSKVPEEPDAFAQDLPDGFKVGPDGSITIQNLLKTTIVAATHKLMESPSLHGWCVSVFEDNAGIFRFDDRYGVCVKVETHNHPSAIEPYGGAATGIGGCMRDIMGTGLSAKPIANMDVFCVADPNTTHLPKGAIAPKRILQQVVAGVRDYGNRKGIPTVNGSVYFHDGYVGNPLVFAGCVGVIPLDMCFGSPQDGDRIIVLGGATGRDGIHGATFSSAELTDTHADEFAHAVQIGNPITQKKTMDVILAARDHPDGPLFHAITDCGAGGFSSAVGEMGRNVGARVTLEAAPLKYAGLSYTEIWISEAQERMVLAVPPGEVETLRELCEAESVSLCDLGQFGNTNGEHEPELALFYKGSKVGQLSMRFLHEGLPRPTRDAQWPQPKATSPRSRSEVGPDQKPLSDPPSIGKALYRLLSHPNIASKHWIVRQYDHEVQGAAVVKPLVGPYQDGPSDAAVVRPVLSSDRAIAIGAGLQPAVADDQLAHDADSYWMALAAIDEAVRNVVCVGADPARIALLDNFCWASCDDPKQLGGLVRAAKACHDGALAYLAPFISGKDSLNNQFTTDGGRAVVITPTLLITAVGIVPNATQACTMDAKTPGNFLMLVGVTSETMGGSHYRMVSGDPRWANIPRVDRNVGPAAAAAVAALIKAGLVAAAHDCSDGGFLVAAAEMAFGGRIGLELDLSGMPTATDLDPIAACYAESPSRYLLEIPADKLDAAIRLLGGSGVPFGQVGIFTDRDHLTLRSPKNGQLLDEPLVELREAWRKPLDW